MALPEHIVLFLPFPQFYLIFLYLFFKFIDCIFFEHQGSLQALPLSLADLHPIPQIFILHLQDLQPVLFFERLLVQLSHTDIIQLLDSIKIEFILSSDYIDLLVEMRAELSLHLLKLSLIDPLFGFDVFLVPSSFSVPLLQYPSESIDLSYHQKYLNFIQQVTLKLLTLLISKLPLFSPYNF